MALFASICLILLPIVIAWLKPSFPLAILTPILAAGLGALTPNLARLARRRKPSQPDRSHLQPGSFSTGQVILIAVVAALLVAIVLSLSPIARIAAARITATSAATNKPATSGDQLRFCDGKEHCAEDAVACVLEGDDSDTLALKGVLVSPGQLPGTGLSGSVFWSTTAWKNEECGTGGGPEWVVSYGSCSTGRGTGLKRCKSVVVRTQ